MPDHARQTGIAMDKTCQFMLWLIPTVEKFPQSLKFSFGNETHRKTRWIAPNKNNTLLLQGGFGRMETHPSPPLSGRKSKPPQIKGDLGGSENRE